ncbi:GNAT family N-acetyltransferase [Microbacterium sp. NPDC057659]|uniref:GNAT family N-acetyltransferase n=1 Tax=Microbacterium sp. NPDC057659 TaxID=3346198 RepID=UPI00366DD228
MLLPITDEVLPTLIDVAAAGVHDPDRMPFSYPWTDASADTLPTNFVQYHWGTRTRWSTDAWALDLAVEYDGEIVGTQGFTTHDYLVTRTGETGSWLGLAHHGRGIGTRMRQAICAFAFDHLDAEEITSAAFADNPASLAVSRKVGYRADGRQRLSRRGEAAINQRLVLDPDDFVRGEPITVHGVAEFRAFIGLDQQNAANAE